MSGILVLQPLVMSAVFGWAEGAFSVLMTGVILVMAGSQMLLFPPLQAKLGLAPTGALGFAVGGAALLGMAFVDEASASDVLLWVVLIATFVFSIALASPAINVLIANLADPAKMGFYMSLSSVAEQAGRIGAPVALGWLYERRSPLAALLSWASGSFLAAAGFACVAVYSESSCRDRQGLV